MIRRNNYLVWAVVLLLVTNAATLATIWYHRRAEGKQEKSLGIQAGGQVQFINGRFLRQELGYSDRQMDSFRVFNQRFRPLAMQLTFDIDSVKSELYERLRQPAPDTAAIRGLSEQVGALHARLKYETSLFFLQLRTLSLPGQRPALEKAFAPLFNSDPYLKIPGRPHGAGPYRGGYPANN